MSGNSFLTVSEAELSRGLEYASVEKHVQLDRDMLRSLINDIGARMRGNHEPFQTARFAILRARLSQTNKSLQERRSAYSAAIAKVFTDRRTYLLAKKPKAPKKVRKPRKKASSKAVPISVGKGGQLEWLF